MELLIDTWNVLHQTGILPPESAGIGTQGLVRLIQESRWKMEKITLVCDGTPSNNAAHGPLVRTLFTGVSRTADDEIIQLVSTSSATKSLLVITSDRAIIRSIKARGAQHLNSAMFLQTLVEDNSSPKKQKVHRPSGLSPTRAQEWREEFGIDEKVMQELRDISTPNVNTEPITKSKVTPTQDEKKQADDFEEPLLPHALLEEARKLINPRLINQQKKRDNNDDRSD